MTDPQTKSGPRSRNIFPQLLLPILVLILLSNMLTLGTTYLALDRELRIKDDSLLVTDTEKATEYLSSVFEQLQIDARQAHNFPALEGVIRSQTDTRYHHELEEWKARLAQLFSGMMRANPALSQMRYIQSDGVEIVRVDRYGQDNSLQVVLEQDLQDKSNRPYFIASMGLPEGQVYLSKVDLNQENGQIIKPLELVLRAGTTVYSRGAESPQGVLILNLNLDSILARIPNLVGSNRSVMVANAGGDYLYHSSKPFAITDDPVGSHNLFSDFALQPRELVAGELYVQEQADKHLALTPFEYGDGNINNTVYVAVSSEHEDIVSVRDTVAKRTTLTLSAVLLVTVLLCVAIARRIATPLTGLSQRIRRGDQTDFKYRLAANAPNELHHLAESFDAAYARLAEKQHQLEAEISAKKQAQRTLERKVEQLNKANQELRQFTYIASHDLQEPLRTIRSFIGVISKQYEDQLDNKGRTMLGFVEDASARMQVLVKDLLDYGRIGEKSSPAPLDLNQLVMHVQQDLASAISSKSAKLTIENLPNLRGYETELRMLFQNLLSNALKFSRPGTPPEIHVSATPVADGWRFLVRDNGIGIAKEHREKIFGVFKRLHNKQEYPGTGIGLAHCKKVVELHNGHIWAEESSSGGTQISFILKEPEDEKT